jgi:histone acetyltransferase (RNA polymerase elongator complex component)
MKMKNKHKNIPIFIPHMGCPNMCVFCNQRKISGKTCFDIDRVRDDIESALSTIDPADEVEIAYFGGSFTGIDRSLMISLLDIAESFIKRADDGRAGIVGVRMSTRPDYISEEILDILDNYTVSAIELGLQSMDDEVLKATKRGHTAIDAERACRMIKARGYYLVGQMMIGLPASSMEKEIYTANKLCEMGCDGARIYPTVVFRDTELGDMTERGEYSPIELEDAIQRSVAALSVLDENRVDCIRIGLCASDNLLDESCVMGGANHPAMGELVLGELYFYRMCEQIKNMSGGNEYKTAEFEIPVGDTSKLLGQRGKNRERIKKLFGIEKIKIAEKDIDKIRLLSLS